MSGFNTRPNSSMPELTINLPHSKIPAIQKIAAQYGDTDRSPLQEITTRAIYWGGTWGLLLPSLATIPGRKKSIYASVSPAVERQWREWLALYDIPSTYAIAYLCCNITLPPLPIDWELGAIAASTWYRERSVLKLPKEFLPKFRHGLVAEARV